MLRSNFKLTMLSLIVCIAATEQVVADGVGQIPAGGFRSPEGDARFSPEAGVKPLNNLVFELLNLQHPGSSEQSFRNPREGWIYIRVSPKGEVDQPATVLLDQNPVALKPVNRQLEVMRYVSEGPHHVALTDEIGNAERLEVRAIGELFYATYGSNPHIEETGVYTWNFLREHCLDHYNSIIGESKLTADGRSTQEAEIKEWSSQGKRWYVRESVPYDVSSAEGAYDHWSRSLGMQHPLMSGIWADEFGVGEKYGKKTSQMYPLWIEAIRRLHANPKFSGRAFYAYGPSRLLPAEDFAQMQPFLQAMMECDYRMGPEWYLTEARSRPGRIIERTEDLLADFSPGWEQASRESFERMIPRAAANRVINIGILSELGWECSDLHPDYNFNVYLESQFQFLATDPAYFGVRGVQGYHSGYCGEEQTRLFAKLVRHYAIEGNTNRFLHDPYVLPHLKNGDFTDGTAGWNLTTAEGQPSIAAKTVPGFGTLQARYHAPAGTGDTALWTRRSSKRPNLITQQIRQLTPGRLYSLRMLTGDYKELTAGKSVQRKHAVSKTIENVELVESKCFQATVGSGFWYPHGDFNSQNPYWLNYHQIVFRARGDSATLQLSDWSSAESPGGPADEEILWNFIQLQPYFE